MSRIFYPLIMAFFFFSSISASANGVSDFNFQNYIYDDEGSPMFVKIYIDSPSEKFSNCDTRSTRSASRNDDFHLILNRMSQKDQRGSYIVVPIKNRKFNDDDDDDKDESVWECPYCGTINESYRNTCKKKGCVLYR